MELTETEKKKRYLREYRNSVNRLKRLWAELAEVKSMKEMCIRDSYSKAADHCCHRVQAQ